MPYTLTMPKLSPTMEQGTIVSWAKKEGEFVEAGDLLMHVATDKATVEYHALDEGYLRKILIDKNQVAIVNQAVGIFTLDLEESIKDYTPEGITLKSKEEITPPVSIEKSFKEEPREKTTSLSTFIEPAFTPAEPLEELSFSFPIEAAKRRIKASPLAKKIAEKEKLDLSTVQGSGPRGRIVKEDLKKAQKQGLISLGRLIPEEKAGAYEEIPLTPMRKVIGERLQASKTFIPHYYITEEINIGSLVDIRTQLKNMEVKVTINDFIVRAVAIALKKHPEINSGFHSQNKSIIRFKTVDICVAVTIPNGLITPIIRWADYKNVTQISVEIKELAHRAKEGKLEPHEYQGGSFTISNLGMYGIEEFIAVINPPQAAILAIAGIKEKPVVSNGTLKIGKVMKMTLSLDHRVIDGAQGAEFMNSLKSILENPAVLLLS